MLLKLRDVMSWQCPSENRPIGLPSLFMSHHKMSCLVPAQIMLLFVVTENTGDSPNPDDEVVTLATLEFDRLSQILTRPSCEPVRKRCYKFSSVPANFVGQ